MKCLENFCFLTGQIKEMSAFRNVSSKLIKRHIPWRTQKSSRDWSTFKPAIITVESSISVFSSLHRFSKCITWYFILLNVHSLQIKMN